MLDPFAPAPVEGRRETDPVRSRVQTRCQPAHSGRHTTAKTSATAMPANSCVIGCLASRFETMFAAKVKFDGDGGIKEAIATLAA